MIEQETPAQRESCTNRPRFHRSIYTRKLALDLRNPESRPTIKLQVSEADRDHLDAIAWPLAEQFHCGIDRARGAVLSAMLKEVAPVRLQASLPRKLYAVIEQRAEAAGVCIEQYLINLVAEDVEAQR